jgi:hypothetical protein
MEVRGSRDPLTSGNEKRGRIDQGRTPDRDDPCASWATTALIAVPVVALGVTVVALGVFSLLPGH